MIILYTYTDKRIAEQEETRQAMREIEKYYDVLSIHIEDDYSYIDALMSIWRKDCIITIEQDNVPSINSIESLRNCQEINCAYPYLLTAEVNRLSVLAIQKGLGWNNKMNYSKIVYPNIIGLEYADMSGLGFTKIGIKTQLLFELEHLKWNSSLDSYISEHMYDFNLKYHLHFPLCKHNHLLEKSND